MIQNILSELKDLKQQIIDLKLKKGESSVSSKVQSSDNRKKEMPENEQNKPKLSLKEEALKLDPFNLERLKRGGSLRPPLRGRLFCL